MEFKTEVERRIEKLHDRNKTEEQLAAPKAENIYQSELSLYCK